MRRFFVLFLLAFLAACGGGDEAARNADTDPLGLGARGTSPKGGRAVLKQGEELFAAHCLVCHTARGTGLPGLAPTLVGSSMVMGAERELILGTLMGSAYYGADSRVGKEYSAPMIPYAHLSDAEIAALLTYVRDAFGQGSAPVSVEAVASARATLD